MEKRDISCTIGELADWCSHGRKQYGVYIKQSKIKLLYDPAIPFLVMAQREMRFTSLLVPGNNIRSDNTLKVLEENIGRKISDISCSNIFTYISPRAKDIKERINKWDLIKRKSFCTAKENINKIKKGTYCVGEMYL